MVNAYSPSPNQAFSRNASRSSHIVVTCLSFFWIAALCLSMTLLLGSCTSSDSANDQGSTEAGSQSSTNPDESSPAADDNHQPTAEELLEQKVQETLRGLSLEQKVAQLFVVRPESITGVDTVIQAGSTTQEALKNYPVGGIVYFADNLTSSDQAKELLSNTARFAKDANGLPIFLCVDEEGGTVTRIGGREGFDVPNPGDMAIVGEEGDPAEAKTIAETIGNYLRDLGFNLDFAPDADVANNPESDTMKRRSFGADPQLVASMVQAQVEGFLDSGILCCAKHFPGIGAAVGDSHDGSISTNATIDEMMQVELVPFKAAIDAGVPMIMVGHLLTPNATDNGLPASLSPDIVTGLLRDKLGFKGIVITDALEMGAIEPSFESSEVGVVALQAGVDMILMPQDFQAAYQGILDALSRGDISEERVDQSLTRILRVKLNMG